MVSITYHNPQNKMRYPTNQPTNNYDNPTFQTGQTESNFQENSHENHCNQARPAWMNDELVCDIPAEKLDFLAQLFGKTHNDTPGEQRTQQTLMLRLLPMLKQAKAQHLEFTPAELQAAIAAIRRHTDTQTNQRMDDILAKASK